MTMLSIGIVKETPDGTVTVKGDTREGYPFTMHMHWTEAVQVGAAIIAASGQAAGVAGYTAGQVEAAILVALGKVMGPLND